MEPNSSFRTCSLCEAVFPRRVMRVERNTHVVACPSCAGTCACCREKKEELAKTGLFCNTCKAHAAAFARDESPVMTACPAADPDGHDLRAPRSPITRKRYSVFVHWDPDELDAAGIHRQRVPELAALHIVR